VNSSLQQQMQHALAPLVGLALWEMGRAADLQWFAFGKRRVVHDFRGEPKEVGEFALHLQCAWRIAEADKVLVASRDLYYPAGSTENVVPQGFRWDVQGANRRDALGTTLFQGGKEFTVREINVGAAGAFSLTFEGEMSLEVFPDDSALEEHWRIFRPAADEPHWVFRGEGLAQE
jgi:hypothetical protein